MFKLVVVFGLILVSASGEDTFHTKLSRYAEPSTPSNQTNQIKKRPSHHDQRTHTGNESFIRFSKWPPTDYPCPPSVKRPVAVQGQPNGNPNKFEKAVELKSSHSPEEKRQPTRHNSGLNLLEDWMEDRVKISHISHIYIGEAMYPYIYEESRVFKTDPPQPSSGGESPSLKEVMMSESKHKKEEEVPIYEITKIYEIK